MNKERFKAVVATHLLLIKNEQVLLLMRHNTGYADGFYSVIAGHVDGNESIIEATIREAKEEANLILSRKDIEFGCVLHRKTFDREVIDFFFVIKEWPDTLENQEPDKCKELKFFSIKQLPTNMVPYVAYGIECVINKIPQSTYGW